MTTTSIANAIITPQANVYFEGRCVSHSVTLPDGQRLTVGVILPSSLRFSTDAAERMECVAGSCEYRLTEQSDWTTVRAGATFNVPGKSSFEIRCSEPFHYICRFE